MTGRLGLKTYAKTGGSKRAVSGEGDNDRAPDSMVGGHPG